MRHVVRVKQSKLSLGAPRSQGGPEGPGKGMGGGPGRKKEKGERKGEKKGEKIKPQKAS